ncbi:MAG: hypothetical protein KC464_33725, partial [Myxococcales bacterium]|nr:hypothetical protein [Myxococcales bacterium]
AEARAAAAEEAAAAARDQVAANEDERRRLREAEDQVIELQERLSSLERDLARANEAAAAAPAAGNGSGTLPDGFGQHLSSLQDSIDSLRANMRAASDETAVMDQTDSVQVITSALTQATEEIERARDALRALDEIVAP